LISLDELRQYMTQELEGDRKQKSVRARGRTVDEALGQASLELGLPVGRLEYEIVQRGSKGTLGLGRQDWIILAYEAAREAQAAGKAETREGGPEAAAEKAVDRDGEVFVHLSTDGVLLKVVKSIGRGERVSERMAMDKLAARGVRDFDASLVARVVKHADGEYIKVGEFAYNPAAQATLSASIADQEMKAFITASPPGRGGADLEAEEIIAILRSYGVTHGIKEEEIRRFADSPRYNEKVLVAEGDKPENGRDAEIVYNFRVRRDVQLKEKNGRVDFKELDLVQNVEAGQVVARKAPRSEGQPGRTVTGRILPAKAGKDVQIELGKNVKLAEDGLSALAVINGQVLLVGGKINVEPIYTVEGDVNLKTGNILFLGTVFVKGNVEDGFTVKAAGNIEIMGSVGKSVLDAEGDIIVHQGILGKTHGRVHAGGNLVSKFIEHARAEAEANVVVSDGIIHSFVDANKRIICQGRRAAIVGGRLRATEEIHAKILGSVAGTETILEVGLDPVRKEQLSVALSRKGQIEKRLEELELNLRTLENLKKVLQRLPEDKAKDLEELAAARSQALAELDSVNQAIAQVHAYLAELKEVGRVSASDRVFPGVKIFIRQESLAVRNEFRKVTFALEGKEVRVTRYEPLEQDYSRKLEFPHAATAH
jgi:uncharacterized protein (DUF342 family)